MKSEIKEKNQSKKKFDLGSDNVLKTFLAILIPTLIAQVISGTFVVFDTFFVSKGFQAGSVGTGIGGQLFSGDAYAALGPAAVSYAMPYTFFIIGVGLMIGAGLASIMTKAYAKDDKVTLQNAMDSYIPLTIIFGVILMILLLVFSKVFVWFGSGFQKDYLDSWFNNPLLNSDWGNGWAGVEGSPTIDHNVFEQVNGHILSQASWYLRIQALGTLPYIYMCAGVIMLRVQGKAKYATSFSVVGLVVNLVLDFVFIIVLKMNVVGAAMATVIGQFATAAVYYIYFNKFAEIRQRKNNWNYALTNIGETSKSGISIMMLQVLTGLVLIIFTFSIGVANYGDMSSVTNYTAVYQGYNAVFIFLNLVIIGIAQSMSPIIGYNIAKNDVEKVKKARLYGMGSSLVFALISWILIIVFAKQVIGIFYTVNGEHMDYITSGQWGATFKTDGLAVATKVLRLLFLTFPIAVMINVSGTYLQAIGETKKTSTILFGKVFGIIPIIIVLVILQWSGVELVTAKWDFGSTALPNGLSTDANLNLFLALPMIDAIFLFILVWFLVDSENKIIKKMNNA